MGKIDAKLTLKFKREGMRLAAQLIETRVVKKLDPLIAAQKARWEKDKLPEDREFGERLQTDADELWKLAQQIRKAAERLRP